MVEAPELKMRLIRKCNLSLSPFARMEVFRAVKLKQRGLTFNSKIIYESTAMH